jgi:hypothetical protein
MYPLTTPSPLFFPCNTSCVVDSSSYFFVAHQEEGPPVDNWTLRFIPMVMSGSHYPLSSLPSQEMEKMGKDLYDDHFISE